MTQHDIIWQARYTAAVEHLRFTSNPDDSRQANGCVVGVQERVPFRIAYDVKLDTQWCVREVVITDLLDDKPVLHLLSNGEGRWTDKDRKPLPQLDGCIDIDFTATPFTNTLPICRLKWEVGVAHEIQLVFIVHPKFDVYPAKQTYTCLSINDENMRFHFKMDDFEREITVNREGFVVDYPGLFQNVLISDDS